MAVSNDASEGVDESDVSDGDDPEVDVANGSGNRQMNKMQETEAEEEKHKKSIPWTPQGIFTRSPICNTSFLKPFYSCVPIHAPRHGQVQRSYQTNARKRRPCGSVRRQIFELSAPPSPTCAPSGWWLSIIIPS